MPHFDFLRTGDGVRRVYEHDADLWDPFVDFTHRLMRGPSPLSIGDRELIAAYTSALNACRYCSGAHGAAAAAFGYSADLLKEMVDDLEAAPIEERLRNLLGFIRTLTLTPTRVTPEDVTAVIAAGWSELALRHAIAICSRYCMVNRLVMAHGTEADAAELERVGERMAGVGAPSGREG